MRSLIVVLCVVFISGCEALHRPAQGTDPEYAPTYPTTPDPKELKRASGAIYSYETAMPLFETPRARHVGDILTVFLMENTDAKQNQTTVMKKNDNEKIVNASFLGRPISLGAGYTADFDLNNQRSFDGESASVQNNKLAGNISVTVSRVLANGNLVIQGEKWVRINQAREFVRLSGIVRPQDIKPNNSIGSEKVANAKISYGGVGQVNNTNAQGWLSRILWSPLFPT